MVGRCEKRMRQKWKKHLLRMSTIPFFKEEMNVRYYAQCADENERKTPSTFLIPAFFHSDLRESVRIEETYKAR